MQDLRSLGQAIRSWHCFGWPAWGTCTLGKDILGDLLAVNNTYSFWSPGTDLLKVSKLLPGGSARNSISCPSLEALQPGHCSFQQLQLWQCNPQRSDLSHQALQAQKVSAGRDYPGPRRNCSLPLHGLSMMSLQLCLPAASARLRSWPQHMYMEAFSTMFIFCSIRITWACK